MNNAADDVIAVYRRHAGAWTTARGSKLDEAAWLDKFAALLPTGGQVLDLGCGSGIPIASELVGRGLSVTGVDSSPEMIALFQANFPTQKAVLADMRDLALGMSFSGVIAWDSFFHLPPHAQRAMFPLFEKHAKSSAALMFTSGPAHGEVVGELEGDPLYHASLDPAEYRLLLEESGFKVVAHVSEDPACRRTAWLAQKQ